jgi:hypothetical protein
MQAIRLTWTNHMIRALLLMLVSVCAYASDTTRIDGKIITTGMSVAEVASRVGQPTRNVQLQNWFGAAMGERWEYWEGKRMVSLIVQGGKVVKIDEQ